MSQRANTPDLEELFAQREQIDRALQAKLAREMAVMFTDIVGSTAYFEKKGDLEGMALLKRHNDLLFPIVESHRGRIVKTIGDAIMAVFDATADAARCGAGMQQVLEAYRREHPDDPMRIRIGMHAGKVLLHQGDVFGDTVNTAARVASKAQADEVLLSEISFRALPADGAFSAMPRGSLELKGKSERLAVVALRWREGEEPDAAEVFEPTPVPAPITGPSPELFVLELQLGPKGLKVTALDGAADKGTVKAYEEVFLARAELDALAAKFGTFMHGGGADSYLARVRDQGVDLFRQALSERARKHVLRTGLRFFRIHLDDELVHVPWELMHDGREFLGLRFAMGRMVAARASTSPEYRLPAPGEVPGHALVVSNPSGDLPAATHEGKAVAGLLREGFVGEVRHVEGPVARKDFFAALEGARMVHFAGHANRPTSETPGGFRLADGMVSPEEVTDAIGRHAPALVFANTCYSSTGGGWTDGALQASNLASAFLMRGTQHYVGSMWDLPDRDGLAFALRFYESALAAVPFGEAIRSARLSLASDHVQSLSFAGYVLYGEPRAGFPQDTVRLRTGEATRSALGSTPSGTGGLGSNARPPGVGKGRKGLVLGIGALAGALSLAVIGNQVVQTRGAVPAPDARGGNALDDLSSRPESGGLELALAPTPTPRTGPIRIAILPFKNMTGGASEDRSVASGLAETIMTDFGQIEGFQLIERQQLGRTEAEMKEAGVTFTSAYDDYKKLVWAADFDNSKLVDPSTRAVLGKLKGAEVVVMGGYQRSGKRIRANARLVDVETGQILGTVKVERADGDIFGLQDDLSAEVPIEVAKVRGKLRGDFRP